MIGPNIVDPFAGYRALLEAGQFQAVMDRYAAEPIDRANDPSIGLAAATAATRLRRFAAGERLASSALAGFGSRADEDGRLRVLNLIGAISYEKGELVEACRAWTDSLALARALGDTLMVGRTSNNLGIAEYLLGNADSARRAYAEALSAYQRLGDRRGLAETTHNLAVLSRRSGAFQRAAELGDEAIRHAEVLGDHGFFAWMIIGRARTIVEGGDLELAKAEAVRAKRLFDDAGIEFGHAEVSWVLAEISLRLGELLQARDQALAGLAIAASVGASLVQAECAELAGHACRGLGDVAQAEELTGQARDLYKTLGAVPWLERITPN